MLAAEIVALIVPPRCAACRATGVRATDVLCARCRRALPWLPPSCCVRCALPLPHVRRCPALDAPFDAAWSAVAYEGVARDAMHALKFAAARPLAEVMAAQIAAGAPAALLRAPAQPAAARAPQAGAVSAAPAAPARSTAGRAPAAAPALAPAAPGEVALVAAAAGEVALAPAAVGEVALRPAAASEVALVAVPAHSARRRARGFDPAELLARALARRSGLPLVVALRRGGASARQLGASRDTRRDPRRLAFTARGPAPQTAVLIDDVHTTGATLAACAGALKEAGAQRVVAITWARTL